MIFASALGMTLVVNSSYENAIGGGGPLLKFDSNDSVKITFDGTQLLNVDFYFGGLSDGEGVEVQDLSQGELYAPQAISVILKGGGDGADLHAIRWNTQSVLRSSNSPSVPDINKRMQGNVLAATVTSSRPMTWILRHDWLFHSITRHQPEWS